MSEILIQNAVKQMDKSYNYKIDKNGNLIKEKYNILKDPYTLVTIAILILGFFYYMQLKDSAIAVDNIDQTCVNYQLLKDKWILEHPGKELNVREVINQVIVTKATNYSINDTESTLSKLNSLQD